MERKFANMVLNVFEKMLIISKVNFFQTPICLFFFDLEYTQNIGILLTPNPLKSPKKKKKNIKQKQQVRPFILRRIYRSIDYISIQEPKKAKEEKDSAESNVTSDLPKGVTRASRSFILKYESDEEDENLASKTGKDRGSFAILCLSSDPSFIFFFGIRKKTGSNWSWKC